MCNIEYLQLKNKIIYDEVYENRKNVKYVTCLVSYKKQNPDHVSFLFGF